MKILFHTHEFNIKEGGPCTKRIDSLAKYLSEKGHEITILASSHNKKTEGEINRKYKVIYSYSTKKIKKSTLHRMLNNFLFGLTSFLKSIFKVKKPDIVVTTSPPPLISIWGYWIAKIKKAKIVYDIRDIWPDVAIEMGSFSKKSIYYKVFNFIAKFMYKHSDIITTVTPGKVEKIKKYAKPEKVKYIANGFDDAIVDFEIDEEVIKQFNLRDKFTVTYIGNVGLAQNLDALLELAKENIQNQNLQFIIFGDGAYKNQLEDRITKENINNVILAGKIDYSKVKTILINSKISFISLKNNKMTDSVPTKMFDALGLGCPVILLANGDSCKILEESALGESAQEIESLKEKFKYMIENYDKYEANKENAINYTKNNYSRREIAKKFEMEVVKEVEK